MAPLEHAIRSVCKLIGADPNAWQGFRHIGQHALDALLSKLPEDLAQKVREHL